MALTAPVVTCDALVEGVHFRLDWTTARDLGWKAIAVNVSDIAAMGGRPVAAFVTLALPPGQGVEFVDELYTGMEDAARVYGLTIAGGDTVKSLSGLMLSVTVVGDAPQSVLRFGAAEGDVVMVTGTLGDSAAGLFALENPELKIETVSRDFVTQRHHRPQARLQEILAALQIENAIHAALDVSDGLSGDTAHIALASDVTLEIDSALLPISAACRTVAKAAGRKALDWALTGGEDYELLLCIAPEKVEAVRAAIAATGTSACAIGRVQSRETAPVMLLKNKIREPAPSGFAHF